jgi:hypothetical protein
MTEQLSIFTSGLPTAMEPHDRAWEGCHWVLRHRPAWSRLRTLIHSMAANPQCPSIRRGDVYILAQQRGMSISEALELRFDNNLWSVLSRLMIMQDPIIAHVVHPKRCALDMIDLRAIYIGVCGDDGIGTMSDLFAACPQLGGGR